MRRSSAVRQRGVGLIEVLMAVLVLSIGVLGIAALQTRSLSTSTSASLRSMATINTYSILDVLRSDKVNAKAGAYSETVKGDNCPASGSTLASNQLHLWCEQLAGSLGAESTTVGTIDCGTDGKCTITISFDDSRAGKQGLSDQTAGIETFTTTAEL
jgi:type IV pilus assembly protein PilV